MSVSNNKYLIDFKKFENDAGHDKIEIVNEDFMPNTPKTYFVKGDVIEQNNIYDKQNLDWIAVSYKNDTKSGWIRRKDVVGME